MKKRILVTGATRGIGSAIAQKFKTEGHIVIGTGTKQCDLLDYLDEYYDCDFSNIEAIEKFCLILQNLKIDVLVNNAGINIVNNFCDIRATDFNKMHLVNIYAPFRISQTVIPYMLDRNWGRIVNISSIWGKISKQGRASYSVTKFGIDGMTVAMANEFASQGILCNAVAPGLIGTEMTWKNLGKAGVEKILENVPIKRLAQVEEVANLVYMLGSDQNTYISGQNIAIDGGFTRA